MSEQKLIRSAVQREGAARYLLISIISFGGSVMITRLFLYLTGYPKVGRGELHIAHVLWGGLLLFIASLLPLIFSNRWVYTTGAVLSGVGVGLFIDEVGKFITMNNNYFFPPAAPIIYTLFLLTVLVYLRVRRPSHWSSRDELYRVLDGFSEVLDRDLEPDEKKILLKRLERVAQNTQEAELAKLARSLSDFLSSGDVMIVPERTSTLEKGLQGLTQVENRILNRSRLRTVLIFALVVIGTLAIYHTLGSILQHGRLLRLEEILTMNMLRGQVRSLEGASWFLAHLAIQLISGLLALLSAVMLAFGNEKRGIEFAVLSLVLSLTLVALLSFFVDQFSAVLIALVQFLVFLAVIHYRRRYLKMSSAS